MLGIDILGGASYRSHAVKAFQELGGSFAVGVFWKEYGSAGKLIDELCAAGCKIFRIHILWDSTHAYGSHKQREAIEEYKKRKPPHFPTTNNQ